MQSNIDCVLDDINEFPDSWVELYNAGKDAVDLKNYSLGKTEIAAEAYAFPQTIVNPGEFILIYCDKESKGLHTSFRLESSKGGAVYLFKKNEIVDSYTNLPKMLAPNVAQGRLTESSAQWGFLTEPTPGMPNCGAFAAGILPVPSFSHAGSVNPEPFELNISVPVGCPPEAVVRYTLDGSEPSSQSPIWKTPIDVSTTTIVKAKLFAPGYLSPISTAHSYIFLEREMTLPLLSITSTPDYLYGDSMGILVNGTYNEAKPNFEYQWRRPINIELFDSEGSASSLNQLCETRVKGESTRKLNMKSLAFYANKRFGEKRFKTELFPKDLPGGEDWKSFEIRAGGNDLYGLYFRDALIQYSVAKNCDLDYQFYRPAIVLINGNYIGLMNIRSRTNEDLIYATYNKLEDIDMVERNVELKAGTMDRWNEFTKMYRESGHSLDEYRSHIDVDEYTNMMIMNIILDNKDFPGNNIVCWRERNEQSRWRWIAKDADAGLGAAEYPFAFKTLDWYYDSAYDSYYSWANKPEHTLLFRQMLDIPEYRQLFIERCAIYMGDFLTSKSIIKLLDEMVEEIETEHYYHRMKNYAWMNYPSICEGVRDWIRGRIPFFYSYLSEFFNIGEPVPLRISKEMDDSKIKLNGIGLVNDSFDGQFFKGHKINVESDNVPNWLCRIDYADGNFEDKYFDSEVNLTIPEDATNVFISDGIISMLTEENRELMPLNVYDCNGYYFGQFHDLNSARNTLNPGLYIFKQGSKTFKQLIK